MMAKLTKVCNSSVKTLVEFSIVYTILDGPHSSLFKSYVAFIGCSKVIILLYDWKDIANKVKTSIWADVQLTFKFSDDSKLKKSGSLMLVRLGEVLSHSSRVTILRSLSLILSAR
ncbi:unnamed protein product [Lathyrus oleraceus]